MYSKRINYNELFLYVKFKNLKEKEDFMIGFIWYRKEGIFASRINKPKLAFKKIDPETRVRISAI